mgnify:CR=1 FL=1
MSDDRIPMTREGYEKLKADLDRMQNPVYQRTRDVLLN